MAIIRLRRDGQCATLGQVMNMPIDVNTMIQQLPRRLADDHAFNVAIEKKLIHKSSYLSGYVEKSVLEKCIEYLQHTPLYRHFGITVNWPDLEDEVQPTTQRNDYIVGKFGQDARTSDILLARQQTLPRNEDPVLDIAPGQRSQPLNIIFDSTAEHSSFCCLLDNGSPGRPIPCRNGPASRARVRWRQLVIHKILVNGEQI